MRVEEQYICDYCNTRYKTAAEAQDCEAFHSKSASIIEQKFNSCGQKYPYQIVLAMDNGHKCIYRFDKTVVEREDEHEPTDPNGGDTNNG